jgi:hypothetical protein
MAANSRHLSLTAKQRAVALPLDPPPFFLETEIRLVFPGLGLYTTGVGLLVLTAFRSTFPGHYQPLPSLTILLVTSVVSVGFYYGVRLLSYWCVWAWVIRKHPPVGRIHPAARGELPRNAFLFVLLCPCSAFIPLCAFLYIQTGAFRPELWLAVAVAAAISIKDLRAVWHLSSIDPSRWVKETSSGMDVLKLIDTD